MPRQMTGFACRFAVLVLLLCTGMIAQEPYGMGTAGSGGFVPVLTSNQAWMGNAAFALNVTLGVGGASAVLGISTQPASFLAGGTQVLVSLGPADLVQVLPFTLGGAAGAPGAGSATLGFPLTFPVTPSLAGTSFFVQAGIVDLGGPTPFSASAGLRVTLTMPPLVVVSTSVGFPTNSTTRFIDPNTMTAAYPAQTIPSDAATGMAFAHGGRDLFISRGTGQHIIRFDFTSGAPVWSVFFGSPAQCYGVAVDRTHDLLYTILSSPSGSTLAAIDANSMNATFGQQMAASGPLLGTVWGLSPSGTLAGVLSSCSLSIIDTDPSHPTYLQTLATTAVPQICSIPSRVVFTQDDQYAFILMSNGVTSVCSQFGGLAVGMGRYHVPSATWTDFNPSTSGTQLVGWASQPVVQVNPTMRELVVSGDGSVSFVISPERLYRVAFDPVNPGAFTATLLGPQYSDCYFTARGSLTPDGSALFVAATSYAGQLSVLRIDPATLAIPGGFVTGNAAIVDSIAVR